MARHFEIENGKFRTVRVENKLAEGGDRVKFEAGSKEFVIQFKETNPENRPAAPGYTPESSDKASWTATTNSAAMLVPEKGLPPWPRTTTWEPSGTATTTTASGHQGDTRRD